MAITQATQAVDYCSLTRRCHGALLSLILASALTACSGGAEVATEGGSSGGTVIVCTTGGTSAVLTWDAVSDPDPVLAGYKIYYGTMPATYTTVVVPIPPTATTHTVMGLSSRTTYFFAVTAYSTSGPPNESPFSSEVCKTVS